MRVVHPQHVYVYWYHPASHHVKNTYAWKANIPKGSKIRFGQLRRPHEEDHVVKYKHYQNNKKPKWRKNKLLPAGSYRWFPAVIPMPLLPLAIQVKPGYTVLARYSYKNSSEWAWFQITKKMKKDQFMAHIVWPFTESSSLLPGTKMRLPREAIADVRTSHKSF